MFFDGPSHVHLLNNTKSSVHPPGRCQKIQESATACCNLAPYLYLYGHACAVIT